MGRPIRILYLIDKIVTPRAGTERQLLRLIHGLPRDEFQPYLAFFQSTPWVETNDLGLPWLCIGSSRLRSLRVLSNLARFSTYLRKEQIDIVQCHFPTSITAGVLAARLAGVRQVLSCRRDMGFWYTPTSRLALRFCNLFATRILVNSKGVARMVEKIEGVQQTKIHVIYNGVPLMDLKPKPWIETIKRQMGIPPNAPVVGIVANFNRLVKRLDLFLYAAAYVAKQKTGAFFVIIGSGDMLEESVELSRRLGIKPITVFLGSVDDPIHFVQTFDVAVNSSDSEGFSNAILEYMACGIPVVATDTGGNREIVKHGLNGILVPPGDAIELAAAILKLLQDKDTRLAMGIQAKADASEYSIEKMILEYTRLYISLMRQ
jgi:glycosyltransferase involved in cell wall biosynthesis